MVPERLSGTNRADRQERSTEGAHTVKVHSGGMRGALPIVLSVGALALSGVVAGCGDETQLQEAPTEVTFEQVLSNPEAYAGQQVTVLAGVDEVVASPGAFTLGGEIDGDELYVLPTTEAKVPGDDIDEDTVVRVQGRVETVDDDLLEEDELLVEDVAAFDDGRLDGSTAIVASQVEAIDNPH